MTTINYSDLTKEIQLTIKADNNTANEILTFTFNGFK
jgi:hypothetical protein